MSDETKCLCMALIVLPIEKFGCGTEFVMHLTGDKEEKHCHD